MIDLQIKALVSAQYWCVECGSQQPDYSGYLNDLTKHVFFDQCNGAKYAVAYINCFDMNNYAFIEFEDEYTVKGFTFKDEEVELTNKAFCITVSSQMLTECSFTIREYIKLIMLNNADLRFKNRIQLIHNLKPAIWLDYIQSE